MRILLQYLLIQVLLILIQVVVAMDDLDVLTLESLHHYFCSLSYTGFKSMSKVDALMVLTIIDFLFYRFAAFITDEDLKTIANVLQCINDNCTIKISEKFTDDSLFHNYKINGADRIRSSEIYDIRNSELNITRTEDR